MNDHQLLRQYLDEGSEAAFSALVQRHVNLVYSAAFRRLSNSHAAEEVTQSVFCLLATKARQLGPDTALVSWLYQTASFKALKYWRGESRRRQREQEAAMMSFSDSDDVDAVWPQLAPYLDDAINALGEHDRLAILRRFFEQKPLREIGEALGISEDAARMRVNRALEKLRGFLLRKGAVCSLAILGTVIAERAVQAAPRGLEQSVQTAALAAPKVASAPSLIAILLTLLAKAKLKTALIAAVAVLTTVGVVVFLQNRRERLVQPNSPASLVSASLPGTQLPVIELREPLTRSAQFTLDTPPGALAIQSDGKILTASTLGGLFVDEESGTLGRYDRGVMRFYPDGSLDRTFYVDIGRPDETSAAGSQLTLLKDGRIFVSGTFRSVDAKPRHGHAVVLSDGRVDQAFDPWSGQTNVTPGLHYPRLSYTSAALSDGSIVVMSRPVRLEDEPSKIHSSFFWAAYRLDSNGKLLLPPVTNSFDSARPAQLILRYSDIPYGPFPEVPVELIRYAVRLPDGGAVIAVRDPPYWGTPHASLQRYDKEWRLDANFTNHFETDRHHSELSLHLQRDGKLLVAGLVGTMNGEEFPGLVRLETNGALDRSFRCETGNDASGRVMDLAIQEDGRIVICGFFSKVDGRPTKHIARLNSDGSVDDSFKTPFLSHEEFNRRRTLRVAKLAKAPKAPRAPAAPVAETDTNTVASLNDPGLPEIIQITGMDMTDGLAGISFNGRPRQLYVLQATETMNSADWTNVATNQASASGAGVLRDNESKNHPLRLYRIATP